MQTDPIAAAARDRLGATVTIATQLYGLTAAVRALITTHPEPEKMHAVFDQLIGQMFAYPGFLAAPDQGVVLRDFAATLFQPPVEL
ncbi:hypothetical protein ACLIKD_04815 [Azonexus sp. IMCC34842]|uniref:hypothetical protein n=1 Tax=Azonexus sp. IMCC34842 TaxID=3420950 RepID=UPI003D137934